MDNKQAPKSDVQPRNPSNQKGTEVPQKPSDQPSETAPRRYDEADPSWSNPDVQMQPGQDSNVNVSKSVINSNGLS